MWCDPNRKAVAMNIFTPEIDRQPSREEAEAALAVLRRWAGKFSPWVAEEAPDALVIDLTAIWAGPLAGHLLWLAGAEVVKFESLTRPDLIRRDDPATFGLINQGKDSVLLDFASERQKAALIDLIRRRSLEQAYLDALATLPEALQPSLEEQAILLQALVEIDRLLQGLGTKVKQVFMLSQFDGLTYPQIAERLNISVRSVNNHMAKAMEHCCLMQMRMQLS